jgi:beta-N-acetylhexosaminidase
MVSAYVRGASHEGMISCAKHFPGHGGTNTDSHFASPVIDRSRADLDSTDFVPFRAAIAAGVPTLMTTHITFPALDPDHPASLSGEIIGRLLREELSFRGVVVSDDLEMAGVSREYSLEEGSLQALRAGADMLIISGMLLSERDLPALLDSLHRAAERGDLPQDTLRAARRRVRDLKSRSLTWNRGEEAAGAVLRHPDHLALLDEVKSIADP